MGCGASKDTGATTGASASESAVEKPTNGKSPPSKTEEPESKSSEKKETDASNETTTNSVPEPTKGITFVTSKDATDESCSFEAEEKIGKNLIVRYGAATQKGRDPDFPGKPNQDCYGIYSRSLDSTSTTQFGLFAGVFDGHGPEGQPCSHFARDKVPRLFQEELEKLVDINPDIDQVQNSLKAAHIRCNNALHETTEINDSNSGTTAISCYVYPDDTPRITISCVGDSRAILGTSAGGGSWMALPLSKDQTPRQPEEAQRCRATGARILSFGEIYPHTYEEGVEDPPRVWHPTGNFPGTAFTRSIGDKIAEPLGVSAEPEHLTLKLSEKEHVVVLMSDGITDVLSNEQVIDICHQYRNHPLEACRQILEQSHEEWLLNDDCDEEHASYDDMTVCCLYFGPADSAEPPDGTSNTAGNRQPRTGKRVRQKTLRNLEDMAEN